MGDRAVITTKEMRLGVYLHWDGEINQVKAFLKYCKDTGVSSPEKDASGWAALCAVACNYNGNGMSVGIDNYEYLDSNNRDNGTYIIKDWEIVKRKYNRYSIGTEEKERFLERLNTVYSRQAAPLQIHDSSDAVPDYDSVIITDKDPRIGIYFSNAKGGLDIDSLLLYCKMHKFMPPEDDNYGWSYLTAVMYNYFVGSCGDKRVVSVELLKRRNFFTHPVVNVYPINEWERTDQKVEPREKEDILGGLLKINGCQPCNMSLSREELELAALHKSQEKEAEVSAPTR